MDRSRKLKAAQKPAPIELKFSNEGLEDLHSKFSDMQETLVKVIDKYDVSELVDKSDDQIKLLTDTNNNLVKSIIALEMLAQRDDANLLRAIEAAKTVVPPFPTKFDLKTPIEFPKGLAKDKSLLEFNATLKALIKAVTKDQGQKPSDFVPMRRVVKRGNTLEFDDHVQTGGGGGGTPAHNSWSSVRALAQKAVPTQISSGPGAMGGYMVSNENVSFVYLQIFDKSTTPTVGTDVSKPFGIPPGAAANVEFTNGIKINSAIWIACTTTAGGLTPPSTGLDMTILYE